jgi:Tol biopolymer transport system component
MNRIYKARIFTCALTIVSASTILIVSISLAQAPTILKQVTFASSSSRDSGEFDVALSADGTKIVFGSDSDLLGQGIPDDQTELWLYDRSTVTFTRVTSVTNGNPNGYYPSIDADGTRVAFHSFVDFLNPGTPPLDHMEIWLYDTTAMTFTRITSGTRNSTYPKLNGNGTRVVFASEDNFLGQPLPPPNENEVWLYDTATMTFTRVTTQSESGRVSGEPGISAAGTKIVFASDSDFLGQGIPDNQFEVWLFDTTAMTYTRITTATPSGRDSRYPSVSGNGQIIALKSDSDFLNQGVSMNHEEIWRIDTAAMTYTRVTSAPVNNLGPYAPSVNSDGTKTVFSSQANYLLPGAPLERTEIWLYDAVAGGLTRITSTPSGGGSNNYPTVSSDGKAIAFSKKQDFIWEVWLAVEATHRVYLPIVLK